MSQPVKPEELKSGMNVLVRTDGDFQVNAFISIRGKTKEDMALWCGLNTGDTTEVKFN
ncbi:hypothetical protein [Methylobacter luteus]|uniref:hypothetical protein n=1 Tax=Methylobacter luteus TaxID=415 RepID=UPI0012DDC32F|nr:hypothetical protein [Methylobacter luteus]